MLGLQAQPELRAGARQRRHEDRGLGGPAALALHVGHCNLCPVRRSLRAAPAMEARTADDVWPPLELLAVIERRGVTRRFLNARLGRSGQA